MPPKRRFRYNAGFKLKVVRRSEEIGIRPTAREFSVSLSNVRRWRKDKNELEKCPKSRKTLHPGLPPKWPDLEEKLMEWVQAMRQDGHAISTVLLRLKAKEMAKESNIADFSGGIGWCMRFMRRQELSVRARTTVGQALPDDWEQKVDCFIKFMTDTMTTKNVSPSNIFNMDEVPLSFDAPPSRTIDKKGTKHIFVKTTGHEKTHFTVVLGCSAAGKKLPPMVIFKRKTLPKETTPEDVVVKTNEKGWMNGEVMLEWLKEIYSKREFSNEQSVLVLDSMTAHRGEAFKTACGKKKTALVVIPGGLTKIIQPLDLTINRVFKMYVRYQWEKWMVEGLHTYTKTGHMRKATFTDVCNWVKSAWASVRQSTIEKAFVSAGILSKTPAPESTLEESRATSSAQVAQHYGSESEVEVETEYLEELQPDFLTLFHSDTDGSDFNGFSSDGDTDTNDESNDSDINETQLSKCLRQFNSDSDESEFLGFTEESA